MYCKGGELMNLQEILDEKQMTMYRLSKEAKVSFTTISEICSGKRKGIKLDTAIKIANALNIRVTDLIKGEQLVKVREEIINGRRRVILIRQAVENKEAVEKAIDIVMAGYERKKQEVS